MTELRAIARVESPRVVMNGGENSEGKPVFRHLTVSQLESLHDVLLSKLDLHITKNAGVEQLKAFEIIPLDFLEELTEILKAKKVGLTCVELAGGAASHVLLSTSNKELAHDDYHDLDVVFQIDILEGDEYQTFVKIDNAVWECLARFITQQGVKNFPDAFVDTRKLVNTTDGDLWSIISLHNNYGRNFDLKFVHRLEHKYQFSVDSFRIPLTPFVKLRQLGHLSENGRLQMERYKYEFPALDYGQSDERVDGHIHEVPTLSLRSKKPQTPCHTHVTAVTLPTFYVRSVFPGGVDEALSHLLNKLIWIDDPSVIRGGGLLKYVKLRTQDYVMHHSLDEEKIRTLEGYMVQRFLCDFGFSVSALNFQIETYLSSRFVEKLYFKGEYLMELYNVVRRIIPQRDPRNPGYTMKKFLQTQVNLVESKKIAKRDARACRDQGLDHSEALSVLIGG